MITASDIWIPHTHAKKIAKWLQSYNTPQLYPKSNMKPKGLGPMARMLRDDPEGFDKKYLQHSLVEIVFSIIKEWFGAAVRAKLEPLGTLQLTLKCVCYNLLC